MRARRRCSPSASAVGWPRSGSVARRTIRSKLSDGRCRSDRRPCRVARLAAAVPPARVELSRLRLEDVFIKIVTEGGAGSDAARALRAGLQAAGTEGAFA